MDKSENECLKKLSKHMKYCYWFSGITFPIQLQDHTVKKCKESVLNDYCLCIEGLRKSS